MAEPHIALAHDWLVALRGGEMVLDRLARLFGPTELYTLVTSNKPLTPAIDACRVITSPLQRFPGAAGRLRRHYLPLMGWAVQRLEVQPCDLLISTSSAVMKSIKPPKNVPHLCYCHSPARYIWDQMQDYSVGAGGRVRSLGLRAVRSRFQQWDRATAPRVTHFLANSGHTAKRIERCYGRTASVVYPPVRTDLFSFQSSVARQGWYLIVSALEPYKRVDLAVEAANREGFALTVVGGGSQFDTLQTMAGQTVRLLGRVNDDELLGLYRQAKALIHPQQEDFGIIAVEAQATGCPVIAYRAGGAVETVTERTGVFFNRQQVDSLVDALKRFEEIQFESTHIRTNAERFSEQAFDAAILQQVHNLVGNQQ